MTQYYIVEIRQYQNGEFEHTVHYAFHEDPTNARLNAESKYHTVLAAAAISDLPTHAAIMFTSSGQPVLHQCYTHAAVPEPEPETETAES